MVDFFLFMDYNCNDCLKEIVMINIDDEHPVEDGSYDNNLVSVRGDEYSQVDEFSESEFQPWDGEFCQDVSEQHRQSEQLGDDELLSGEMVVVRDEYSQESFFRNKEKPQKSSRKEFDETIRLLNKKAPRKNSVVNQSKSKPLTRQPEITPKNTSQENETTQKSQMAVNNLIPDIRADEKVVVDGVGKEGVGVANNGLADEKTKENSNSSSAKAVVDAKAGKDTKRKYDKEGKKNRVETITRCVTERFSDRDFTLSDIKAAIKDDIARWEDSGVSNIDVELSVCVKSMGVEVVGQAPRGAGQRGRPSNIMRLVK